MYTFPAQAPHPRHQVPLQPPQAPHLHHQALPQPHRVVPHRRAAPHPHRAGLHQSAAPAAAAMGAQAQVGRCPSSLSALHRPPPAAAHPPPAAAPLRPPPAGAHLRPRQAGAQRRRLSTAGRMGPLTTGAAIPWGQTPRGLTRGGATPTATARADRVPSRCVRLSPMNVSLCSEVRDAFGAHAVCGWPQSS